MGGFFGSMGLAGAAEAAGAADVAGASSAANQTQPQMQQQSHPVEPKIEGSGDDNNPVSEAFKEKQGMINRGPGSSNIQTGGYQPQSINMNSPSASTDRYSQIMDFLNKAQGGRSL